MKFLTCEIDHIKNPMYARLLQTLENSVKANMPNAIFEKAYLKPKDYPQCEHGKNSYMANSVKLNYWKDKIKTETDNLCLIDGDTIVLKDVSGVFDLDFDIAITKRSKGIYIPYNGGVMFVRPSSVVNEFFDKWAEANNLMLKDVAFHKRWYAKYKGINQASFGYMVENLHLLENKPKIIELPCFEFNACDSVDWAKFGNETKILHVKSELRIACIYDTKIRAYQKAIDTWKYYENLKSND